ncbi:hypothetical protein RRG08_028705 [Elysia crispata]|uniref:Uncharacterized protein n=1 Tax=Elysia crispata TaxID=231223 RepID=A0AAE1CJI7_9GAST|nr:hypothetical protein RRG08_028705 [Elysia crispata]
MLILEDDRPNSGKSFHEITLGKATSDAMTARDNVPIRTCLHQALALTHKSPGLLENGGCLQQRLLPVLRGGSGDGDLVHVLPDLQEKLGGGGGCVGHFVSIIVRLVPIVWQDSPP